MGSMSASDAAPLPRLGEVFFDVRGESRTMRLSWYADTEVAVFSIWQGGTCTGTFRLPIADLPRMVEALQRGPRARDDLVTGEQPGAREQRQPAAPGPPIRARPARPDLPDTDIETGQTTAAVYSPPAEPEVTGYRPEPPLAGYPPGPPLAGYPAEPPLADYPSGPPLADYPGEEPLTGYPPEPALADYPPGAPLADYPGEEPLTGYPAEPPGGYSGDPLADGPGYQAAPPAEPGHRGKTARRRRGSRATPEFADEPRPGRGDEDLPADPGGYPAEPAREFGEQYPAEPARKPAGEHAAGSPGRRGSRHRSRERGGETAGYRDEPRAPETPREPPARHSRQPTRRRSSGYQDPLAPGYPGDSAGYSGDSAGYPGEETLSAPAGYPAGHQDAHVIPEPAGPGDDPLTGGYPGEYEPADPGDRYRAGDYQSYPEELAATGYGSPTRPYIPDSGDTGEPFAEDPPERRKPRGRRRAEPSPDSHPYGPPPTVDEPRQRGRYPGRH